MFCLSFLFGILSLIYSIILGGYFSDWIDLNLINLISFFVLWVDLDREGSFLHIRSCSGRFKIILLTILYIGSLYVVILSCFEKY